LRASKIGEAEGEICFWGQTRPRPDAQLLHARQPGRRAEELEPLIGSHRSMRLNIGEGHWFLICAGSDASS
jgi:hypothetical protein